MISQINKGKIIIMTERGYTLQEISSSIGISIQLIKQYLKEYRTGKV